MPKQPAFPGPRDAMKRKRTRRALFLSEMAALVSRGRPLVLIASHDPRGDHPFRAIKHRFDDEKLRCRGLATNRARVRTLFALANLFLVRRRLTVWGRVCPETGKPPR